MTTLQRRKSVAEDFGAEQERQASSAPDRPSGMKRRAGCLIRAKKPDRSWYKNAAARRGSPLFPRLASVDSHSRRIEPLGSTSD